MDRAAVSVPLGGASRSAPPNSCSACTYCDPNLSSAERVCSLHVDLRSFSSFALSSPVARIERELIVQFREILHVRARPITNELLCWTEGKSEGLHHSMNAKLDDVPICAVGRTAVLIAVVGGAFPTLIPGAFLRMAHMLHLH